MENIIVLQLQRKFKPDNLYVKRRQLKYPENLLYIPIPDIQECVWTLKRDALPPLLASCKVPLEDWVHVWDLVSEQVKSEINLRKEQKRINMDLFHDVCKGSRKKMDLCFLFCFNRELKETLMDVDNFDKLSEEQWANLVMRVSQMLQKYGIFVTREPVNHDIDATYGLKFETKLKTYGGVKNTRWM